MVVKRFVAESDLSQIAMLKPFKIPLITRVLISRGNLFISIGSPTMPTEFVVRVDDISRAVWTLTN